MTVSEFINELEDILEIDSGSLELTTDLEEVEEWDSLSMMSVIALFNKKLGVELGIRSLRDVKTVQDLINLSNQTITL